MTERWLPALGLAIGLCLMTLAAVAQGQPAAAPPTAMPGPGGDGPDRPRGGWERHRHDGGPPPMGRDEMCRERYAGEAGFLAYLGAKLDLTPAQQPLWDTYHRAMLDGAAKLRQVCLESAGAPQPGPTALDRRDRMEKFLTARLDFLHATRPPLDALYQSLTPEQRAVLDHPRWHPPGR